ncbi:MULTISPECIES: helix-turn-helix domain-containing protein [unclassified Streptomyces]|uniref:helix-turn-helix domain-containing protein n=1 Tax=unclassified Streptomyces TaxID=2593676 RepID=UPI0035DB0B94
MSAEHGPRVVREAALDWVKFDAALARDGSVPPVEKALYAALASFADQGDRETPAGWDWEEDVPTRAVLARCIGKSKDTVDRATKGLEARGLLDVERRQDPDNPRLNIPSVYRLLDQERWDDRAAERAARRRAARQGGGRMDAARGGRMDAARGGRMDAARGGRMDAALLSSVQEEVEDLSPSGGAAAVPVAAVVTGERETQAAPERRQTPAAAESVVNSQQQDEAGQVVAAYEAAAGLPMPSSMRAKFRQQAVEILASGRPVEWVAARAAEMPGNNWVDLIKQCAMSKVPLPGQQRGQEQRQAGTPEERAGLPPWCGSCGDGGLNQAARVSARWRTLGGAGTGELCPECHPDRVHVGA